MKDIREAFRDTSELRAERVGQNPRWFWCSECGWRWEFGKSGEHDCAQHVIDQRDEYARTLRHLIGGVHEMLKAWRPVRDQIVSVTHSALVFDAMERAKIEAAQLLDRRGVV